MASDDEVDYMSDSFLHSICGKEDIRPGLMKSHAQKRDHIKAVNKIKSDKKNRMHNQSAKDKEAESLVHGLNKPIDSDNVGFKMLQKLGFKPGAGLGKSGEGRTEPVVVELKTDRQGLGRKRSLEEINKMRARFRAEAKEKMLNVDDYRSRKADQAAEKRAWLDLKKSQHVCWELDSKEFISKPAESWFWPGDKFPQKEDDDEEEEEKGQAGGGQDTEMICDTYEMPPDEECEKMKKKEEDETFSVQEQLEMLTMYLRRTYLYCIWCGHSFDDEKDLQEECPGPSREDH